LKKPTRSHKVSRPNAVGAAHTTASRNILEKDEDKSSRTSRPEKTRTGQGSHRGSPLPGASAAQIADMDLGDEGIAGYSRTNVKGAEVWAGGRPVDKAEDSNDDGHDGVAGGAGPFAPRIAHGQGASIKLLRKISTIMREASVSAEQRSSGSVTVQRKTKNSVKHSRIRKPPAKNVDAAVGASAPSDDDDPLGRFHSCHSEHTQSLAGSKLKMQTSEHLRRRPDQQGPVELQSPYPYRSIASSKFQFPTAADNTIDSYKMYVNNPPQLHHTLTAMTSPTWNKRAGIYISDIKANKQALTLRLANAGRQSSHVAPQKLTKLGGVKLSPGRPDGRDKLNRTELQLPMRTSARLSPDTANGAYEKKGASTFARGGAQDATAVRQHQQQYRWPQRQPTNQSPPPSYEQTITTAQRRFANVAEADAFSPGRGHYPVPHTQAQGAGPLDLKCHKIELATRKIELATHIKEPQQKKFYQLVTETDR